METRGDDDVWLIKFYAPWCSFCKQLDPVWHQIGSELRSLGSPVSVGKADATTSTGLAKEFKVRGYPAILMLKKSVKYNYSGPRTKDGILEFAHRVGGPLIRSLSSLQLFQHAMNRHDVMFVYVGATSQLKKLDGDLKSWINRERFPNYLRIDSYTLYAMGESGTGGRHSLQSEDFYFGFMEGSDYINGLVMGEVVVPSFIVVNLSSDGYVLPPTAVETERQLLDFLNGVLDGSVQVRGGNGVDQRVRRFIYDIRVTLTVSPVVLSPVLFVLSPVSGTSHLSVLCVSLSPAHVQQSSAARLLPGRLPVRHHCRLVSSLP
uniref:protein disulfide-isomerase n=1 Tax=Cyclopterus lumpus TaxID=8103 RepID=A0A8C3A2E4_CYCLU